MSSTTTHGDAKVPSDALTVVTDADDLGLEDDAAVVLDVLRRRMGTMGMDRGLAVALEDWAHEDWSDYDIADGPIVSVKEIEDYSADAYKVGGAANIEWDAIGGRPVEEVSDGYLNEQIGRVDETHEDFIEDTGEMFLPKSAVSEIFVVE
jgi:hypothetical protein